MSPASAAITARRLAILTRKPQPVAPVRPRDDRVVLVAVPLLGSTGAHRRRSENPTSRPVAPVHRACGEPRRAASAVCQPLHCAQPRLVPDSGSSVQVVVRAWSVDMPAASSRRPSSQLVGHAAGPRAHLVVGRVRRGVALEAARAARGQPAASMLALGGLAARRSKPTARCEGHAGASSCATGCLGADDQRRAAFGDARRARGARPAPGRDPGADALPDATQHDDARRRRGSRASGSAPSAPRRRPRPSSSSTATYETRCASMRSSGRTRAARAPSQPRMVRANSWRSAATDGREPAREGRVVGDVNLVGAHARESCSVGECAASVSAPRVRGAVHALQPLLGHVRVHLGRRQVRVAEQLLDDAQVRAALEQVGRERVAQRVGVQRARRSARPAAGARRAARAGRRAG